MGSFYTNIHLRTANRPLVESTWQSYWEGRGESSWAMVSPVYDGWVSVFDWHSDQQETDTLTDLASHLSRAVECPAIAFQVQNSDLAEYWLFNSGQEVDHYTSNADYFAAAMQSPETNPAEGVYDGFGPDSKPGYPTDEDLSDGGNTHLLKSLTGTMASDIELEAILRSPAYIADDILTALASTIGLNEEWASAGYYYLVHERDTITGIDTFHHLPPDQPPNMDGIGDRFGTM
ncbi:MAG: hypothetical protein ACYDBB_01710 [Armatimonadota bacterium]